MDNRTLQLIDYYRIRDLIASFTKTEEAQNELQKRLPSSEAELIKEQKKLATEWLLCLQDSTPLLLKSFPACKDLFSKLKVQDNSLEESELFALGLFCISVNKIKKDIESKSKNLNIPFLAQKAFELPNLQEAEGMIFNIIDETGLIRDLPEIRAIKNKINAIRKSIANLLKTYTTSTALKDVLQSDLPTIRSDRQVLAVKTNFKGRIKGIVHEMSHTGQTVYIEPDDVVQKNNELIQEEYQLSIEIRRILKELTAKLSVFYSDFVNAHKTMIILDCGYAVAKWGIEYKCISASECTAQKPFSLLQARHPLLGEKAVPIDLSFLPDCKMIIITGPNTGGKTVTLKTAALFAALNQSGFLIPAKEGTCIPIFDAIYADIGDEQSIDQSLSTFSSHMKNIADMTRSATNKSLILLDELGSGTDPQEGGAISMAVLDFLLEKKSTVLVTTHHGILKNYGYTKTECSNASVDFNEDTLAPTYKIIMGVPGESHALDIAKRNGLSDEITEKAKSYLVTEQADISALIKGLNEKHAELAALEKSYKKEEQVIREKRRKVDLKELRLKQKEVELQEQGFRRLAIFSEESRKKLENLVRELREGEITREKTLKVKEFIAELSDSIQIEKTELNKAQENVKQIEKEQKSETIPQKKVPKDQLKEGLDVLVKGKRGTLLRQDKKGNWVVQINTLKMSVKPEDLILAPEEKKVAVFSVEMATTNDSAGIPGANFDVKPKAVLELRLLGMRYEEAMKAVEKQIDLALIQHLKNFSIIHGKGNGILQQGVQDYLKNCTAVQEFHYARPEDGGFGKTHVTIRD